MKRHHWLLLLGLIALGALLFGALLILTAGRAAAPSAPSNLDEATLRVAKNLYCPVCPGVPLDVCDTQACVQWRALIREKLARGETAEQIDQYFEEQYGERVLGAPRPQGLNLVVYIVPLAALLVGGGILYFTARRWTLARAAAPASPQSMPQDYRERIEHELKESE